MNGTLQLGDQKGQRKDKEKDKEKENVVDVRDR
jgi:hypothetical protein